MFSPQQFLTDPMMERLTRTRFNDPDYSFRAAQARRLRNRIAPAGKLNILAADHPARRVTKVGDNPLGMADRRGYLARIVRILQADSVDGLMATMDVLEELFILDGLLREAGAPSLLDGKLLIGSLNRGGLANTAWELDDAITGPTPASCAAWRLDGAKVLLRIGDSDSGSLKTMLASAQAITECNALRLPMFLEPLPVTRSDAGWAVTKDAASIAKLVGVVSALGDSSRYLWLKLPYCADFAIVARSTSLPIVLLGGESAGSPAPFLQELQAALRSGTNVLGAMVGRNVLYPGDEDPLAMAVATGGIIHRNWTVEDAMASFASYRGAHLDAISKYF